MGLWRTDGSPNLSQKTRPNNDQQQKKKKKRKLKKIIDFAVPSDHRIKLKECEKKDKYFDLARELKKPWNMQVTIIPIVIGAFGTVSKGLLTGLEDLEVGGRAETIQTTELLRTARMLRIVPETWGDFMSSNSRGRPQTDHLILTRRPDLMIINNNKKEILQNCRLCCPGWPQNKTERMWKER